ncbi:MAG: DEAD/DEAH box helicase [Bacteroidetes bacterium]|nr:DEAD/DEAH box helicase [Bacteroidota bacterium]
MKRTKNILVKSARFLTTKSGETVIRCSFPFNEDNLAEIRTVEGRKWSAINKYWTIPLSLENALNLRNWKYRMSAGLKEWANEKYFLKKNPIKEVKIKGLKGELFPYQKDGVLFIENHNGRALLGDEMGLGKTIQALAWLQLHKRKRPVIIICPASLKLNWFRETQAWINCSTLTILSGTKPYGFLPKGIIIINYDIVHYWLTALKACIPQVIILDESHYIKNNSAKRTKAVKKLCGRAPHVLCLSGTPIENRPVEIYNTIQVIDKTIFPNKWKFLHSFCDAKHNGFGWDFTGASNMKELHDTLVDKIMIRRMKKDVLKDLPDKMYSFVPLEMDNRQEYEEAEDNFIQYVQDKVEIEVREAYSNFIEQESLSRFVETDLQSIVRVDDHKLEQLKTEMAGKTTVLSEIEALKQLAVKGKLDSVIEWVENFLKSGEKLVLFAHHKFVIKALMEHFKNIAVKIDGSVSQIKRQQAIDLFQGNDQVRLFIGNIKAAGIGITLTAASNVAIIEYPWTPGALKQAIDRLHRIGQKLTVWVHYLMALDSIEEKIAKMLDKKQKVLDAVLDGKETDASDLLTELIDQYKYK